MVEMLKVQTVDNKVVINKEDFEQFVEDLSSEIETLEILADKELVEQIKKSDVDIKEGRIYEVKADEELKKLLSIENV
jgi:hypothetical protein